MRNFGKGASIPNEPGTYSIQLSKIKRETITFEKPPNEEVDSDLLYFVNSFSLVVKYSHNGFAGYYDYGFGNSISEVDALNNWEFEAVDYLLYLFNMHSSPNK